MKPSEGVSPPPSPVSQDERLLSELMRKTQRGDQEACEQMLFRIEKLAVSYVHNSLRRAGMGREGLSEDIVQEILFAVYSKRGTYDPQQLFLPWLYAIARYKVIDALRKTKGKTEIAIEDPRVESQVVSAPLSSADLDIDLLLSALPEKQRILLGLVKLEGLSIAEASAKTGFSLSDVKVSIHRALRELKRKLNRGSHDPK